PVSVLAQHEQTLPETMKKLSIEFRNWAKLNNPVIVDTNNIVLDGNHRAMVFKELGYRYIVVCRLDYFNENVLLRYWYRHVKGYHAGDARKMFEYMTSSGATIQEARSLASLLDALDSRPLTLGVQHRGLFYSIDYPGSVVPDAINAYDVIVDLERQIAKAGYTWEYLPCQYVREEKFIASVLPDDLILLTPHITKEMVVNASMQGKIFAPKSTRHIIPARPLNVNVPITWLNSNASLEEINKKFDEFMASRDVRRFPPGQIIDGRFYAEEIFVFIDKITTNI
nr:hypothetical protein [Candidatus Sigynarchaeota archaeon]